MCEIVNIRKIIVRVWEDKGKKEKDSGFVVPTTDVVYALCHTKRELLYHTEILDYQLSVEVAPQ